MCLRLTVGALAGLALTMTTAAAETRWQGYTYQPKTGVPEYDYLPRIAKNVEKATDGQLVISVVPGGALPIKGNDVANAVADDLVQFAGATSGTVSLVPIYGMSRLPLLFKELWPNLGDGGLREAAYRGGWKPA